MGREVVLIRIPQAVDKVIKSTNSWGVAKFKAAKNGIKGIDFKLCSPFSVKSRDKRQERCIQEGLLGFGPKTEYLERSFSSVRERSRIQKRSMISQVERGRASESG